MCASSARTRNGWAEELQRVLIDHRELESFLENLVGVGKAADHISSFKEFVMADVGFHCLADGGDVVEFAGAGHAFMQKRGAEGERVFNRREARQLLVAHLDQRQRFLGNQWIFSSDHRHRLTDKANFV
jgi:hypothetical protein